MNSIISEQIKTLAERITAELSLLEKEPSREASRHSDSLVYIGNWQDAIPRSIWFDKDLDAVDVRSWGIIRTQAINSSTVMLSLNDLLKQHLNYSSTTISRVIYVLRLSRWISLCSKMRTEDGKFKGNIYAIHDTPISLSDSIYLDSEYLSFVKQQTTHNNRKIRALAQKTQQSIHRSIADDNSEPFQAPSLSTGIIHSLQEINKVGNIIHVYNLNMDDKSHVHNLNMDDKSHIHNLNMANENHENELNQPVNIHVQKVNAASSSSSSSSSFNKSLKKETTTTDSAGINKNENEKNLDSLIYPQNFSKNEKKLAALYLQKVEDTLQQDFLDEVAEQIILKNKTDKPVRNNISLLSWLCNQHCQGNTYLTSAYLNHQARRKNQGRAEAAIQNKQKQLTQEARDKFVKKPDPNAESLPFTEAEKKRDHEKRWGKVNISVRSKTHL